MNDLVLLDAGPLGMVTNPRESSTNLNCKEWLKHLLTSGVRVMVPEGADYEVRLELIRARRIRGVARLDMLAAQLGYVPITTEVLRKAADFWAELRNRGMPTADDKALDFDVILAAQSQIAMKTYGLNVIIATTNVGHLARLADAREWEQIGTTRLDHGSA